MTTPPAEYVVIRRRYKHAPHDAVMYEAIVGERDKWLVLGRENWFLRSNKLTVPTWWS